MYPNVKAEMARKGITSKELAKEMGIVVSTLSQKLNGKTDFTLSEAEKVQEILCVNMPLDELFRKSREQ